jgi:murein L,D-transpeptidase YcbB/YkuD
VTSDAPEQRFDLPRPVPVYVVYLTAHAEGDRVAVRSDPYARDGTALASIALQTE